MPSATHRHPFLCAVALACWMCAACAREEAEPAQPEAEPAIALAPGDSVFAPEPERETLPSNRIYYTLTDHAWYAHGEPLVHGGQAYQPAGMPVSASVSEMQRSGTFQGVEYYVRANDPEPAVYVPVFEGYWQVFRATGARAEAPLPDAAPAASSGAADSISSDTTQAVSGRR